MVLSVSVVFVVGLSPVTLFCSVARVIGLAWVLNNVFPLKEAWPWKRAPKPAR